MREHRPRFASKDPARGTDDEVREAFGGYIGYYGTFAVDERQRAVTHYVHGASFPNWIGAGRSREHQTVSRTCLHRRPAFQMESRTCPGSGIRQPGTFVISQEI
jgi:hypothetical protein